MVKDTHHCKIKKSVLLIHFYLRKQHDSLYFCMFISLGTE